MSKLMQQQNYLSQLDSYSNVQLLMKRSSFYFPSGSVESKYKVSIGKYVQRINNLYCIGISQKNNSSQTLETYQCAELVGSWMERENRYHQDNGPSSHRSSSDFSSKDGVQNNNEHWDDFEHWVGPSDVEDNEWESVDYTDESEPWSCDCDDPPPPMFNIPPPPGYMLPVETEDDTTTVEDGPAESELEKPGCDVIAAEHAIKAAESCPAFLLVEPPQGTRQYLHVPIAVLGLATAVVALILVIATLVIWRCRRCRPRRYGGKSSQSLSNGGVIYEDLPSIVAFRKAIPSTYNSESANLHKLEPLELLDLKFPSGSIWSSYKESSSCKPSHSNLGFATSPLPKTNSVITPPFPYGVPTSTLTPPFPYSTIASTLHFPTSTSINNMVGHRTAPTLACSSGMVGSRTAQPACSSASPQTPPFPVFSALNSMAYKTCPLPFSRQCQLLPEDHCTCRSARDIYNPAYQEVSESETASIVDISYPENNQGMISLSEELLLEKLLPPAGWRDPVFNLEDEEPQYQMPNENDTPSFSEDVKSKKQSKKTKYKRKRKEALSATSTGTTDCSEYHENLLSQLIEPISPPNEFGSTPISYKEKAMCNGRMYSTSLDLPNSFDNQCINTTYFSKSTKSINKIDNEPPGKSTFKLSGMQFISSLRGSSNSSPLKQKSMTSSSCDELLSISQQQQRKLPLLPSRSDRYGIYDTPKTTVNEMLNTSGKSQTLK